MTLYASFSIIGNKQLRALLFPLLKPALKLLDFFRGLARAELTESGGAMALAFDTSRLLRSSPAMRELQPMSENHAKAWVQYWKSKGFIST